MHYWIAELVGKLHLCGHCEGQCLCKVSDGSQLGMGLVSGAGALPLLERSCLRLRKCQIAQLFEQLLQIR